MAYLNTYTAPLTAETAAHLLRRATFGPTQQEVNMFVGKTATQAVDILINNSTFRSSPHAPVEMDESRTDLGQQFLTKPYNGNRSFEYSVFIKCWWIGLMTEQHNYPSVLEKLTAFWQNHFVVSHSAVGDYRLTYRYIKLLRANALGNFKILATEITKDPGMLVFQNGNENSKEHPNENYGRELQELFTVGRRDFAGNDNYTEEDVKAAAQVLTGWQVTNLYSEGSTSFDTIFDPNSHDTSDKQFSSKYNNKKILGKNGADAGNSELADLINMLLAHPETPKFICRKLYRWYINPNVSQEVENNVIIPLANFFAGDGNKFEVKPLLKKLLTSDIFFDSQNVGAIVKSPAEFLIGTIRFFNQPVPDMVTEPAPFRKMMEFILWGMTKMQLSLLDQPLVFGSVPYYQTGYSKNWINGTTLGIRGDHSDAIVFPWLEVKPGYKLGIDFITWLRSLQVNFSDVAGTPPITCERILAEFEKGLFVNDLSQVQRDFLIDTIMMRSIPRASWGYEWNSYRGSPNDDYYKNVVLWRCQSMMKYMLRMAEYQIF